ncbi:MAG: DUF4301 family protein [Dysgonamonadaceae bacterium]|jgi:hypothetical protein|nr:DUF4301 family protein [Dysgonamonadaceae bacterium]
MFTPEDLSLLHNKGISPKKIAEQLDCFKTGFPWLTITASASVEKGILQIPAGNREAYIQRWEIYLSHNRQVVKFVPASGAASRMFKNLFEFLEAGYDVPQTSFEQIFFDRIEDFAFFSDLDNHCLKHHGKNIAGLIAAQAYKTIVRNLLDPAGLNYGQLPKGLLKFHRYATTAPAANNLQPYARTSMEEHLAEGAMYARNVKDEVNLHFTVSQEHRTLFESLTAAKIPLYEQLFKVKYHIHFSEQKSSTDTMAVDENNEPFRDRGQLLFRPGGHGALIENLNDIDADIIFIKNIDNVVPDAHKSPTVQYKKLIAGVLVTVQQQIFDYLELIDSGKYTHDQLLEMLYFLQNELNIKNPETKVLEDVELVLYIKSKLNRPIRVCGMVKNVGEPGGGPFLVVNEDETTSPQILESSQIDLSNKAVKDLFEQGTHFNPVDLVCSVRDYKGQKFQLPDYVDKNTGFISLKSKNGKELKALELPGLWNGAMADWNTIFVEVPIETFNPVKTVNDLLRLEHQ